MAYYSYSNLTRELLEVSDFPLSPGDYSAVCEAPITKRDLESQYQWDSDSCSFVVKQQRTITKLEYMNRFTDAELAIIYTLAKTNLQIEIWLEKFKLASEINLDDPRTIAGLYALEQFGLIAGGRASEILA